MLDGLSAHYLTYMCDNTKRKIKHWSVSRSSCLMAICLITVLLIYVIVYNNDIVFSHESGFYDDPFQLTIKHPWYVELYFTLDSTTPTTESAKYDGPIHILDASSNSNLYSMITETSLGLKKDYCLEMGWNEGHSIWYSLPSEKIDKCTVLSVAVYNKVVGVIEQVIVKHYFVGFQQKWGYSGITVISISTPPDNLFDYDSGIYVLGKTFDEEINANGRLKYWFWQSGNWSNKGTEWEREAVVNCFDTNNRLLLSGPIGIRIQGGQSRNLIPKSFNLYNRDETHNSFPDFFNNGLILDSVSLFSGSQDYQTKLRDVLVNELMLNSNAVCRDYIPCQLFLDGEYWGLYFITEKYDRSFFAQRYGVRRKDDITLVKDGALEIGEDKDMDDYHYMVSFLSEADMSDKQNYEKACSIVDIGSLIDYYATMIFVGRFNDWIEPHRNIAMWKTRDTSDGVYEDGRWRWIIYDLNSGSQALDNVFVDTIEAVLDNKSIFWNMCRSDAFVDAFCKRMISLMNNEFEFERVSKMIVHYKDLLVEPMKKNNLRYFDSEESDIGPFEFHYQKGMSFSEIVDSIIMFYEKRPAVIRKCLKENFGWES